MRRKCVRVFRLYIFSFCCCCANAFLVSFVFCVQQIREAHAHTCVWPPPHIVGRNDGHCSREATGRVIELATHSRPAPHVCAITCVCVCFRRRTAHIMRACCACVRARSGVNKLADAVWPPFIDRHTQTHTHGRIICVDHCVTVACVRPLVDDVGRRRRNRKSETTQQQPRDHHDGVPVVHCCAQLFRCNSIRRSIAAP